MALPVKSEELPYYSPLKRRRLESEASSVWTSNASTENEASQHSSATTSFSLDDWQPPTVEGGDKYQRLLALHNNLNETWESHQALLRALQASMSRLFISRDLVQHQFEAIMQETKSLMMSAKEEEESDQVESEASDVSLILPRSERSRKTCRQPRTAGKGIAFRRPTNLYSEEEELLEEDD